VRALLPDAAPVDHEDPVRELDGGEAMGHDDGRPIIKGDVARKVRFPILLKGEPCMPRTGHIILSSGNNPSSDGTPLEKFDFRLLPLATPA